MHQPTDRITHTTVFVTQVVEHWLEGEIASLDSGPKKKNSPRIDRYEQSSKEFQQPSFEQF